MKGDFEKFKQLLKREEEAYGPLPTSHKVCVILDSLEGQHLTSHAEARRIVQLIDEEVTND